MLSNWIHRNQYIIITNQKGKHYEYYRKTRRRNYKKVWKRYF